MAAISWLLPYQGPLKDSKDKPPGFSAFFAEKGAARAARNFQQGGGEAFRLCGGQRGIFNRGAARYSGCLEGGEEFLLGGAASSSSKSSPPVPRVKFDFGPG